MAIEEQPTLILMDIQLPGMDGLQAIGLLKASQSTSSIPVIALTAHAMVGDKERAIREGCDDFATKPVEFASLMETIQKYIPALQETNEH